MLRPHSILIIDDNPNLGELLTAKLIEQGYAVHYVNSLPHALSYLNAAKQPTFIIADRMLDEPIEVRGLGELSSAAPDSKVLVYTTVLDLSHDQQQAIIRKGAYRVLDKRAVDQLITDINVLTHELEDLGELAEELKVATGERSKIMAALIGTDVGVSVIDRRFHRWFRNSANEDLSVCGPDCWARNSDQSKDSLGCWGCTVANVFASGIGVNGLLLQQFLDESVGWVEVQSTPIFGRQKDEIIAVREAVTKVTETALTGLTLEQRLNYIAISLIRAGFGRARIYKTVSDNEIMLFAAASRSDIPSGLPNAYFETLQGLTLNINACPYIFRALNEVNGSLVDQWDSSGPSPLARELGLNPPYFEIPLRDDNERLGGWIQVDFMGLDDCLLERSTSHWADRKSLPLLQGQYGREVLSAIENTEGDPTLQEKLEAARRARLGIAASRSVNDATSQIRYAFEELLPGCRVSVRLLTDERLSRFDALSWGLSSEFGPSSISLNDADSLVAYVARSRLPKWIDDYPEYSAKAEARGDPIGRLPEGTLSTAQIPLRFEDIVIGTISINSPSTVRWIEDGYKEPLLSLAKDTALVLRDLALHEALQKASDDKAAIVAYSVSEASDSLWRHWASQRLAEASALVGRARRLLRARPFNKVEEAEQLMIQIGGVLARVQSGRPNENEARGCSVASVFDALAKLYADRLPRPSFSFTADYCLAISDFILRNILMVLLDNALIAIEDSGIGNSITVSAQLEVDAVEIDVVDNGPGIPELVRPYVLREKLPGGKGQGLGLLLSRGAALQHDGDLTFVTSPGLTRFRLRLPLQSV